MTSTAPLLPCPFCGGVASLDMNLLTRRVYVVCDDCSVELRYHPRAPDVVPYQPFKAAAEAIAAWNRRVP